MIVTSFLLEVRDAAQVNKLMEQLRKMDGVKEVRRKASLQPKKEQENDL